MPEREGEQGKEEGEKEAQEINALITAVEKDTAQYLMGVLHAIQVEQINARILKRSTGDYVESAVRGQARRRVD
jgi:hypothetical protein